MKLPVMMNNNYQIQDAEGNLIAEMWKNPEAGKDGARIVNLLNSAAVYVEFREPQEPQIVDDIFAAGTKAMAKAIDEKIMGIKPMTQSERMKEYWRKKREEKAKA